MMKAEIIKKYFPELTKRQQEQFEALDALYHDWNAKINVISRKDIDQLYEHHVLHSLAIAKTIRFRPGTRILDFGTGGGFPGIPLAILFPDCEFKLIDGTGKKIRVAQEVAQAVGLTNCHPEHLRGEDERGQYHFVVSRAVMPLPDLVKIVRKNIAKPQLNALPNGILCLKGGNLQAETQPFRNIVETTDISTFFAEECQENTYVVSDDTLECIIIDCGAYYDDERRAITDYISSQGLKPVRLLATHGHWDHNLGIDTIYQTYGLRVEAAKEDEFIISDIPHNFQSIIGAPLRREYPAVGRFFEPDEVIRFGHHSLQVLKTPGHSPGSVVFYCAEERTAFTGDTLFRMSVGRTDFDGGSYTQLMSSLANVLAKLPADTVILPGHGPQSTIDYELRYNPYLT